jgi:hypothetical protein
VSDSVSILPDPTSFQPVFVFDVTTSEVHEGVNEPTKFPVELGANISDHIKVNPVKYTVSGVITMTPNTGQAIPTVLAIPPLPPPPPFVFLEQVAINAITGAAVSPVVVSPQSFPIPFDPITDAHTALESIRTDKVLCTVTSTTAQYTDMALTSVTLNRKDDEGKGEFTLVFEHITTVSSATVAAPKPLITAGAPKVSAGAQTPTASTPEQKATVLDAFGHFVVNLAK